jgi:hypothetical protein
MKDFIIVAFVVAVLSRRGLREFGHRLLLDLWLRYVITQRPIVGWQAVTESFVAGSSFCR